jgi:hypothetical protein
VLGVGTANERKGIDLFVETAIALCGSESKVVFVWVGPINEPLEVSIRAQMAAAGLSDRLIFTGLVAHDEMDSFYVGADVFLLTSREDPFPQVVLEALDAGLPVIAFEGATGCDHLIGRGCGRLVTPFNTASMAAAAQALLDRPEEARALGELGREIVASEFSYRRYAFELAALADPSLKRVSVIVPNYNHRLYIEQRLRSIREQTHPVFEVIVLDDASSDGSAEWLQEHLKEYFPDARLILNPENSGSVWKQWRRGVQLATGDFIWIAESDDSAEPEFLAEVLEGFGNEGVVLSYCQSQRIGTDGGLISPNYLQYVVDISPVKWVNSYIEEGIEEISTALAVKNTIPNASAVLFSRPELLNVLKALEPELALHRVSGDRRIYAELLTLGRIAFSSKALNKHRCHQASVVHSAEPIRHLEEILEIQRWARTRFNIEPDIKKRQVAYAQELYEHFGLNTASYPKVEAHPRFEKYFSGETM